MCSQLDAGSSLLYGSKYRGRPHSMCGLPLSLALFCLADLNTHTHISADTNGYHNFCLFRSHTHNTDPNLCISACVSREDSGEVGQAGGKSGATRGREVSPVRISIIDKHVAIRRKTWREREGERREEPGRKGKEWGQRDEGEIGRPGGKRRQRQTVRRKTERRLKSSQGHLLLKNQFT